ncbi:lysozyme inhibitor LprI family protein [Cronobacter turicensis]
MIMNAGGWETQRKEKICWRHLRMSQQEWVNYRDDYCATAVTAGQSSPYFGAYWTSCILNMNKRRIEEIVMTKTMISD